jgi:GNAT superfamily N-acetyltransferase
MTALHIREATARDLARMLELYAQPAYDDGRVLSLGAAERQFARAASYPFYKYYVAMEADALVGTYALLIMDNIGHLGAPSAIVESVAVDPSRQGDGLGRAMMDHALQIARAHGCYKLALSSNVRRAQAHAFYEKLGFSMHGYSFAIEPCGAAS